MTHGRHHYGRPGLQRRVAGPSKSGHRARHRHARTVWQLTAETAGVLAGVTAMAVIAVSGWYTASGATAVAQMLAR